MSKCVIKNDWNHITALEWTTQYFVLHFPQHTDSVCPSACWWGLCITSPAGQTHFTNTIRGNTTGFKPKPTTVNGRAHSWNEWLWLWILSWVHVHPDSKHICAASFACFHSVFILPTLQLQPAEHMVVVCRKLPLSSFFPSAQLHYRLLKIQSILFLL